MKAFHEDLHLFEDILQGDIEGDEILHDPFKDGIHRLPCEEAFLQHLPLHGHRW